MKHSLLLMIRKIKEELTFPDFSLLGNIHSIYKGKGERALLRNDRGIFILVIEKMIADKMNYNDCYKTLDDSMSDSQIGGRKNRGIRNHLFILYSIVNSVINGNAKPIDITAYDVEQCFDSLWLKECLNDLFERGINDDRLAMIYESNSNNRILVKTPLGETTTTGIDEVVMQGSSWGSMIASSHTDEMGKEALDRGEYTYKYKEKVEVPCLTLVDDVLDISECGVESVISNAYLIAKFELKRLKLNKSKCYQIHTLKKSVTCPVLKAHDDIMVRSDGTKYIGDFVAHNGKNTMNVKKRVGVGMGTNTSIMIILKETSLGVYYFIIGMILRETILISSMLLSVEVWFDVKKEDIQRLEMVDRTLHRRFLECARSSPVCSLHLELGSCPLRFFIQARRIVFLHYILNLDENELLVKVYRAQKSDPAKNDWCLQVQQDLDEFGIDLSEDDIKATSKDKFKEMVKMKCKQAALQYLLDEKSKVHRKMGKINYPELKMQEYLQTNILTTAQKKLLYKLRVRMVNVSNNMGKKIHCPLCQDSPQHCQDGPLCQHGSSIGHLDNQEHLLDCVRIKEEVQEIKDNTTVEHDDIYSDDINKQKAAVELFQQAVKTRTFLLSLKS